MLAIVVTFVLAWGAMVAWPRAAAATALREWLVVRPAARLGAIRRGDIVIAMVVVAAVCVMTVCEDGSAGRLVMYAVPDMALWLTSIELSACVDAIVAVVVALSAWRGGGAALFVRAVRTGRGQRRRRARGSTAPTSPANDDDGDRRLAAA